MYRSACHPISSEIILERTFPELISIPNIIWQSVEVHSVHRRVAKLGSSSSCYKCSPLEGYKPSPSIMSVIQFTPSALLLCILTVMRFVVSWLLTFPFSARR